MSEPQPNPANFSSFADWCLHKDSLSEAARHTVEVLLDIAGTSDINEANQILSSNEYLFLSGDRILDITPLQSLTNLTDLDLENNQISDITPLQSLTNLTDLNLGNNQLSDITPLQSLTNLNRLNLGNNQISDITPLQSLTNLNRLNLENNQISDITPLQSLTNLTSLDLYSNQISDITPLQSLTNLTSLILLNTHISDITPLQSLTNLTDLILSCNQISDITLLASLANLTSLNLEHNQISDITPLQSLTNLTYLTLSYNQISDIIPLQSCVGLTALYLYSNQISDITPLQSLTNLNRLHLGDNQILDIMPLQSCAGLTALYLYSNQISDITALQSLTNLTHLHLGFNQISDITPLESLTNLTVLFVDFTPEQKDFIEACCHSWKSLADSTEPIDNPKVVAAVKSAYEVLGLEAPEITFCISPYAALSKFQMLKESLKETEFRERLDKQLNDALHPFSLITQWWQKVSELIIWEEQLNQQLNAEISDSGFYVRSIVTPKYVVEAVTFSELCVSTLDIFVKPEAQKLFECLNQILAECGWIFAFENVCYVCSRPTKLSLDSEYRLHAEGEPALEFSDGYKLYSYHGVTLPEKYGQVHPNNWQAQWLLEEENAELRRVLIQRIGYARICQELQATELDCWKEYALLRIDADIDGFNPDDFEDDEDAPKKEDIYLLKMTCPSTGFIHALRVPPNVTSAKEAIRWVNWDIDSEEFSVQT